MIVVAIFGLLLALAAPPLSDFVEDVQARQNTNELLSSLLLARSEAVTRNQPVSICTADGTSPIACNASKGWHDGWISFEDLDLDGVRDVGEELIDQHSGLDDTSVITTVNFSDFVTYLPSGGVSTAGNFNLCVGDASARQIMVNATGRPRLTNGSCS
jgi:type IV fimbrial biogenesis protein FimT